MAAANRPPVGRPAAFFCRQPWVGAGLVLLVGMEAGFLAAGQESPPAERIARSASELLAPLPTDLGALPDLRQAAGQRAQRYETEHFLIVYTGRSQTAQKLGARLEAVYRAHVRLIRELQLVASRPTHKLEVLLFGTYEQFVAYRQQAQGTDSQMLGFCERASGRIVLFDLATYPPIADLRAELDNLRRDDWVRGRELRRRLRHNTATLNATVIQHEAAHQIQDRLGILPADGAPAWLVEGLAQMFEPPVPEGGSVPALLPNRLRLREFRRLHADREDLLTNLRRILAGDGLQLQDADYCLAWALTDYLYRNRRHRLAAYLRHLATSRDRPAAVGVDWLVEFEQLFGPVDAGLAEDVREHVRNLLAHQDRRARAEDSLAPARPPAERR